MTSPRNWTFGNIMAGWFAMFAAVPTGVFFWLLVQGKCAEVGFKWWEAMLMTVAIGCVAYLFHDGGFKKLAQEAGQAAVSKIGGSSDNS